MLIKNGYHNSLIEKKIKTEINRLNCIKSYGPEKCPVLLIVPYAGEKIDSDYNKHKKVNGKSI